MKSILFVYDHDNSDYVWFYYGYSLTTIAVSNSNAYKPKWKIDAYSRWQKVATSCQQQQQQKVLLLSSSAL